ncbi:MAG TPA: hypothetical protein DCQ06_13630 [Myxococcales bacterium]|nr:hypothetical protein [Myxococcales bacterium]
MPPRKGRKNKQEQKKKPKVGRPPKHNPFADLAQELGELIREDQTPDDNEPVQPAPIEPEIVSLSDEATFAAAMEGAVAQLSLSSARVGPQRPAPTVAIEQLAQEHFERQLYAAFDRPSWQGRHSDPLHEDLMRGALPADKVVDLHGLHLQLALGRVKAALGQAQHAGQRVVRLIHGKGLHSEYGDAVLRKEVRSALSRPPLNATVCAWVEALQAEGGAGVTDVLLRRR